MSIYYERITQILLLSILLSGASNAFGIDQSLFSRLSAEKHSVCKFDSLSCGEDCPTGFGDDGATSSNAVQAATLSDVQRRLPAEFERQHALLVGCRELLYEAPELFVEIVRQMIGRVVIMALVSDAEEYQLALSLLQAEGVDDAHVRFAEVPHDTMWTRDYGPAIVYHKEFGPIILDADYTPNRPNDDRVPEELAHMLEVPFIHVPLTIDGGNVITNGQGLAVSTGQIFEGNIAPDVDESVVVEIIKRLYGFRQIVVLEPMEGEGTGHVDMFATFTSPNTIVIGAYDQEHDPVNAAILDRNASRLAEAGTRRNPLHVVRIPMPPHHDDIWRTYTNVIYANGVVLVPVYPDLDHIGRGHAVTIFSRLLPGWRVVEIDATKIIESEGALHCILMNLGLIGGLEGFPGRRLYPEVIALKENEPATYVVCEKHIMPGFSVGCSIRSPVVRLRGG